MCNDSIVGGIINTHRNEKISECSYERSSKDFRPSFEAATSFKNMECIPSPEHDIPSYQISRGSKRFSDFSEEQDSVLPISPVCTPPSINKLEDFKEPIIHTIGTIVKKNGDAKVTPDGEASDVQLKSVTKQYSSVFDGLGMLDEDVSWSSSMETPAPHPLSLNDYNTIERATLLPENDAKNMQPRALFSPHKDDDTDFVPLTYSSESDEGDYHSDLVQISSKSETSTNMTTLKEWKDDDRLIESPKHCLPSSINKRKEIEAKKEKILSPCSPVFRIKKKKPRPKKMRAVLVKSPVIMESSVDVDNDKNKINCDLHCSSDVTDKENTIIDCRRNNSLFSEQINSIQDDSFQDMSFSCIDELCKNSTYLSGGNTTSNSTALDRNNIEDIEKISKHGKLSLVLGKINQSKFFYQNTEKSNELYPAPSVDIFLKSAIKLEEVSDVPEKKVNESFKNKELTVFNKMVNEVSNCDLSALAVKRIRSGNSPEESPTIFRDSKVIKLDNDRGIEIEEPNETSSKETFQDVSSHFDANDSQMCLTAAYAESLINNPVITDNNFTNIENQESDNKEIQCNSNVANESSSDMDFMKQHSNKEHNYATFTTASGNSIYVSNNAFNKVRSIFKEDYEENGIIKSELSNTLDTERNEERDTSANCFPGFKTASGAAIKINEKALSKAKNLFSELTDKDFVEVAPVENIGFTTASGLKIKISEKSLDQARNILNSPNFKSDSERGEQDRKKIRDELYTDSKVQPQDIGFKTASNKKVEISKDSLRKVQALWKGEEVREDYFGDLEDQKVVSEIENLADKSISDKSTGHLEAVKPNLKFNGFSTASGRNISVSERALSKAKKMLDDGVSNNESLTSPAERKAGETESAAPKEKSEKQTVPIDLEEDFEQLIPNWLHAYNTSPTLIMDRSDMEVLTSREDHQYSTPREQYVIKSPILGTTDRFYNKRKRRNPGRKLIFCSSPKLDPVKQSDFKPNFNPAYKNAAKREASQMNIDFALPFKRRKLNVEVEAEEVKKLSEEIKEGRRLARLEQIKAGIKGKVKAVEGSHLLKKSETLISWRQVAQGAFPERYSEETLLKHGVRKDVLSITSLNAADYKFKSTDFFKSADAFSNVTGFPVGDGCSLIFDDENRAGVDEFARAFFASPGVEPKLISTEWVKNHYKWIVWKFSHYERSFPLIFGGNCLTPHNVLVQLKYRYDREIDRSHRSALKKILEGDDSSAKKLVFCVCDIKKTSDLNCKIEDSLNKSLTSYKLGLTDGWYSTYAQTDSAMTRLIEEGKVLVGTKLVMQGAELLNCDKCVSPLEVGEKIHLKISTNSTRRGRWDVKLGFSKNGGPLLISLNSILPNGGLISRTDVVIARIYPPLYMEKKSDGTHVTRNSRMEDKAAAAYQQQQEMAIDKIYQLVKDELWNKEKGKERAGGKMSVSNITEVVDAEELYKFYENCSDPTSFHNLLTSKQKEILVDYQRQKSEMNNKELFDLVQERIKAEKMNSRRVSQLLKIKIVDLRKPNYASPALFTVWNSMEDVSRIFSEGKAISIFNATPSNSRFFNSVQLNSTRQTRYKELPQSVDYPARKITSLSELTVDKEHVFNEVDVVGIVVATHETSFGSRLSQTIFIADEGFNFAGIVFWGHCKDFGWENVLTVSSIVACSNLPLSKRKIPSSIPSVYANDTSFFTENPKQKYLKEEIKRLKTSLPEDKKSFISKCVEDIAEKLEESKQNSNQSKNSSLPNDSSLNSSSSSKPKYVNGFKTKPNASSTPFKFTPSLLDSTEQEPSPIQKRIEKLQAYGEPPPLTPLLPLDNLEKFKSKFRVPFKNSASLDSSTK